MWARHSIHSVPSYRCHFVRSGVFVFEHVIDNYESIYIVNGERERVRYHTLNLKQMIMKNVKKIPLNNDCCFSVTLLWKKKNFRLNEKKFAICEHIYRYRYIVLCMYVLASTYTWLLVHWLRHIKRDEKTMQKVMIGQKEMKNRDKKNRPTAAVTHISATPYVCICNL